MTRVLVDEGERIRKWKKILSDSTSILRAIGLILISASQRAFKSQRYGRAIWKRRKKPNIFGIIADFYTGRKKPPLRRFRTRPTLIDTGRLSMSFSYRIIGKNIVEEGTKVPYASLHQFGLKSKSKPINERVRKNLNAWLKRQDKEMRNQLGWLLNKKFKGKQLEIKLPKRPFVGLYPSLEREIVNTVEVNIKEI